MNRKQYIEFAEGRAKRTSSLKNCIWAFVTGGLICVIGQLLIDKTKLTPARILTGYVVAGVILGAVGIANMWLAIFSDVGVMVLAVLNAIRALNVKNL